MAASEYCALRSSKLETVTSSNVFSGRYSFLSNQNTGMAKTTRIFMLHEHSNSTQDFSTSSR